MTIIPSLTIIPTGSPSTYEGGLKILRRHRGPAIVASPDPQLYRDTAADRQRRGNVYLYDPFELSGHPSSTWSPLRDTASWAAALRTAQTLSDRAVGMARGTEDAGFWKVLAYEYLAPLLYAAAHAGQSIEALVAWVYGQRISEFDATLRQLSASPDAATACSAVQAFRQRPDRVISSVQSSAQAIIRAYRFTRVARSAAGNDITPEILGSGDNTIYLVGDHKAAKLLRPLFSCLLADLMHARPAGVRPRLLLAETDPSRVGTYPSYTTGDNSDLRRILIPAQRGDLAGLPGLRARTSARATERAA